MELNIRIRMGLKRKFRIMRHPVYTITDLLNDGLTRGLYIESENETVAAPDLQELAFFSTKDGPRDGIYQNYNLRYNDNALLILERSSEKYRYLAAIDEMIPVCQQAMVPARSWRRII